MEGARNHLDSAVAADLAVDLEGAPTQLAQTQAPQIQTASL
jgi:hypothetical protein